MYAVDKSMPLDSYEIIQPSDNQTDFTPGQVIRFRIPRSIGYWDSHLSRAQFNVKTTGANYKMCFNSPYAGVASMVDMVRLSQNGKVISEILDYNQLQHFIKCYELSLSGLQREALQKGLVDFPVDSATGPKALSNHCLVGQGVHRTGEVSATAMQQEVKFQLSLDFVSLFEVLEIVPSIALGDLLLEIRIAPDAEQILKVLPATGTIHDCSSIPATGQPFVVTLTPPFSGFTCLADSPFIVGQSVVAADSVTGALGFDEYQITALSQADDTGIITLTCTDVVTITDTTKTAIFISKGADGAEAPALTQFFVTKSELQLQVVKPPTSYTMDIVKEVESGQMFIDVDTYTTYRNTILSGIKSQTVTLPTTQSRVKSFFMVPRLGSQAGTFSKWSDTEFNYDGVYAALRNYRSQIDGIYYPNTPIELAVMLGDWHFSAEHMRELEKAFDASGLPLRSLLGLKQNFVVGRALSAYGSSTNLTGTPVNIYLQYQGSGPDSATIPNATAAVSTAGTNYLTTAAPKTLSTTRVSGSFGKGMRVRATAAAGALTAVTIVDQGSGYEDGDILQVNGNGAATVTVTDGGTGYTGAAGVTTTAKTGTGQGLIGTTTDTAGVVNGFTITTYGYGYAVGDEVWIDGGNGDAYLTVNTVNAQDGRITLTKSALALDAISFVHHTNRIAVSPMGIEVLS